MEKVTVSKSRKAVNVLSLGWFPVANVKGKLIPDGFKVRTYNEGVYWFATVRVFPSGHVQYRFSTGEHIGDWEDNPTRAYASARKLKFPLKAKNGTNGAVIVGVTYPNLQKLIKARFSHLTPIFM